MMPPWSDEYIEDVIRFLRTRHLPYDNTYRITANEAVFSPKYSARKQKEE